LGYKGKAKGNYSSPAHKAWATRRLRSGYIAKEGRPPVTEKEIKAHQSSEPIYYVPMGKEVTTISSASLNNLIKNTDLPQKMTLYGSKFEAEMIARFGPKWYLSKEYKEAKKEGECGEFY
jgi:hypothetical protein